MTSPSDLDSRGSYSGFAAMPDVRAASPPTGRDQARCIAVLEACFARAIVEVQRRFGIDASDSDSAEAHTTVIHAILNGLLVRVSSEHDVDPRALAEAIGLDEDPPPTSIEAFATLDTTKHLTAETFAAAGGVLTAPASRKLEGVVLTPPDVARLSAVLGFATLAEERDVDRRRSAAAWVSAWLDPDRRSELRSAPFRSVRVLDPAAGTGAFLVAAARAVEALAVAHESDAPAETATERRRRIVETSIVGFERDAATVPIARFALLLYWLESAGPGSAKPTELPELQRAVRVLDPLVEEIPVHERFDLVLANPPYVRQERIPRDRKRAIHRRFATGDAARLSQRSDLYVYFFALLPQLLREGGTAVMLTSNSWLNAGYGVELRRFLSSALRLRLVLEPSDERWFGATQIHTTITIASRSASAIDHDRDTATAGFVRVSAPISEIASDASRAASLVSPGSAFVRGIRRVDLAAREFTATTPWGVWLSAPGVFLDILRAGSLVPLREIAALRFGLKTGANSFFYVRDITADLDDDECTTRFGLSRADLDARGLRIVRPYSGGRAAVAHAAAFPIEARFLRPVFVTPKEARGFNVRRADLDGRAILLPPDAEALQGTFAMRHIERGRALGIDQRPSCSSRVAWWSLPEPSTPPLAHALIAHQRPALFGLPDGILVDANLVRIEPLDAALGRTCVVATLLSSFGLLARELYLMTNLGDGAIKANPIYLGEVPACSPVTLATQPHASSTLTAAVESLVANDYGSIDDEIASPQRAALDDAFLEAIGFDDAKQRTRIGRDLREALADAIRSRTRRSRAERTR